MAVTSAAGCTACVSPYNPHVTLVNGDIQALYPRELEYDYNSPHLGPYWGNTSARCRVIRGRMSQELESWKRQQWGWGIAAAVVGSVFSGTAAVLAVTDAPKSATAGVAAAGAGINLAAIGAIVSNKERVDELKELKAVVKLRQRAATEARSQARIAHTAFERQRDLEEQGEAKVADLETRLRDASSGAHAALRDELLAARGELDTARGETHLGRQMRRVKLDRVDEALTRWNEACN